MQSRQPQNKAKYRIKDFAAPGNHPTSKSTFTSVISTNKGKDRDSINNNCKLYCICNNFELSNSIKCSRCKQSYHSCVANKIANSDNKNNNNIKDWMCLHCLSIYMDPIYTPQSILIQTFFKTQPVYQYANIIQFVFYLTKEQIKNPVQVRGLQDGRTGLAWPMHGEFHLNNKQDNFQQCLIDFKPLLKNSNRKLRKQQPFILPSEKLKQGKNILTFYIPKLNANTYEVKYQVQQRAVYFIGIYSIKKLTKQQLIQKTFLTNKIDKSQSLQLLKHITANEDPQLTVQKIKLCLQCPYMKSRIKIPIRGKKCSHYMVICLDTLIQTRTNMKSREWQCPICNSDINQPVIDLFILSILNDGTSGIQVILNVSGEYEWVGFQNQDIDLDSDSQIGISAKKKNMQQIEKQKQKERQKEKQRQIQIEKQKQKLKTVDKSKDAQMDIQQSQFHIKNKEKSQLNKIVGNANKAQQSQIPKYIQPIPSLKQLMPKQLPKKQKQLMKPISNNKQKQVLQKQQKIIQTINLDDSEDNQSLPQKNNLPSVSAIRKTVAPKSRPTQKSQSLQPLQIMIPEQKKKFNKEKQIINQREKLKQNLRQIKKSASEEQFVRANPKKDQFFITDIKVLEFKPISFGEFSKNYFDLEYTRVIPCEDLANIFRDVI